jgi:hypothetical protein
MPGPTLLVRVGDAARLLALLCGLEEFGRNNGQVRRVSYLPFAVRIGTRNALAGVGILHHTDLIPHESPGVEFVLK